MKNKISLIYLIAILLMSLSLANSAFAQTAQVAGNVDDLSAQKDEKRRQLLELQVKISELQNQIVTQRNQIASLANEIQLYQLQIKQTEKQVQALNMQIDVLNLDIIDTMNQISSTETKITEKKQLLTQLIQEIYEYDNKSPLEVFLARDNFSDLMNEIQNTVSFQNKNQELFDGLKSLKADLAVKKTALDEKKKGLEEAKAESEAAQSSLLAQQAQKANLMTATRGKESKYKELLNDASDEEAQINREIFNLDLAIRQKLGDKSLPVATGTFAWPMEGILTQGFGNTGFTKLGYTFHNGIDIAAPAGTSIRSAADGIVYAIGSGRTAYGNWAVIKSTIKTENDGLKTIYALYAHMQKVMVTPGQGILKGDLVGLEGNIGNTTALLYGPDRGYHLHFSVFDEEGFGISDGAYPQLYGPYQIPHGYPYNPMDFLK